MLLKNLQISKFRNLDDINLDLTNPESITVFLGQNANGKTNLLEAIYLLSFPKSFRGHNLKDMINFSTNYFNINAQFTPSTKKQTEGSLIQTVFTESLQFGYQINPLKKVYRQDEADTDINEFITNLQAVIFTPEDIEIVHGSPDSRRRLINSTLAQFNSQYLQSYMEFSKILKQRNALLKRIRNKQSSKQELDYWNQEFLSKANLIHQHRKELFAYFHKHFPKKYCHIADLQDPSHIKINYNYNGIQYESQFDTYQDILGFQLQTKQSEEIQRGHTLFGPQRDDWEFILNNQKAEKFSSRGEKRSLMLAFKITELQYLQDQTQRSPLLLLDDVFSELDKNRRLKLLELCTQYQTFISTVEYSYFKDSDLPIQIFKVEKGQVLEYNEEI